MLRGLREWQSSLVFSIFCLCLIWVAGGRPVLAQPGALAQPVCEAIDTIDELQPVIDAAEEGSTVCVRLLGNGGSECVFSLS